MLLENKVAVIYGAGGPIGGAVARAFAREGAQVFLSGRTQAKLDTVAEAIRAHSGVAHTAVVDALDTRAVDTYVDAVAEQAGAIDISFNLIAYGDVQKSLAELSVEDFLQPITNAMRSHFLTTNAATRHMIKRGSGVILAFGGGGPQTMPGLGGFKVALDAIESLRRQWACELGSHGIRVVTLKTGGVPDSIPDSFAEKDEIAASIVQGTLLGRAATLDDVGNVAAFVASDLARTLTATEVNISCGALVD
jgi:NAD(P)-dependent dehydrogenase (short-subunit alcohol dehydrogenase family)